MSNLHLAREQEQPQRYNITKVIESAIKENYTLRFNTASKNEWFSGLHPTSKNLLMLACAKHNIKVVH